MADLPNVTARQKQLLIGAVCAALVGAITYLAGQGVVSFELATAFNAIIAGVGGYASVKS